MYVVNSRDKPAFLGGVFQKNVDQILVEMGLDWQGQGYQQTLLSSSSVGWSYSKLLV